MTLKNQIKAETHTPAPWRLENPSMGFGGLYGPDGKIIFALAYARTDERPEDETAANASLITAAPELLEQAKLLGKILVYYIKKDRTNGDEEGARLKSVTLRICHEAIAKAEGRAP